MSWADSLSQEEKDEMLLDACAAFNAEQINETELTATLAKLGFNATDIRDIIRANRPRPPEDEDGGFR